MSVFYPMEAGEKGGGDGNNVKFDHFLTDFGLEKKFSLDQP
jgi:hypothetical protein